MEADTLAQWVAFFGGLAAIGDGMSVIAARYERNASAAVPVAAASMPPLAYMSARDIPTADPPPSPKKGHTNAVLGADLSARLGAGLGAGLAAQPPPTPRTKAR